jgi:hypothetical protein
MTSVFEIERSLPERQNISNCHAQGGPTSIQSQYAKCGNMKAKCLIGGARLQAGEPAVTASHLQIVIA